MKIVSLFILQLFSNFIFAQNVIEISNDKASSLFYKNLGENLTHYNLDSIQNSNKKIIRIWQGQSVLTFDDNANYLQKFTNLKTHLDYFYSKNLSFKLDSFSIEKIKELDYRYYIDCMPTTIEIKENNHYLIKSVGCNEKISSLINRIFSQEIKAEIQEFMATLPSGEYQQAMITLTINQAVKNDSQKTKFYKNIEKELLKNGITTENPAKQPLILINFKSASFYDINKLDETRFKSYKVLDKGLQNTAIYGRQAQYGVVIIETK